MATRKEAADIFEKFGADNQAAANAAFQAASDCLKNFAIMVAYDDRAERLVHHIAMYMVECNPNLLPNDNPTPASEGA